MPHIQKAREVLVEDVVTNEGSQSMAFLDGFLKCQFQLETDTPLGKLDATLVHEPEDDLLFKRIVPNISWRKSSLIGILFPITRWVPCLF